MSPPAAAAHLGVMTTSRPAYPPVSAPVSATIDDGVMATVRISLTLHPTLVDAADAATDATALYGWLTGCAAPDPVTGLRLYPTPAEAARWLHDMRRREGRDRFCVTCDAAGDTAARLAA